MTPLVSIIIPCFNAGRWLPAAVESALAQTWPKKEIIVVNDGSTDDSIAVAGTFAHRGVTILDQPNRGAAAARNAGLRAARGEWIQYLDADDLLAPDKLERQLSVALSGPNSGEHAWCGSWTRFTETPTDGDRTPQPLCCDSPAVDWMIVKLEQHRMMHPAAWLLPRRLVTAAGEWDQSLSLDDDGEYFTRVVLASRGVRCCTEAWSFYRSGLPVTLSGSKSDAALLSAFRSIELSTDWLLQAENSSPTRHACATAFQRYVYDVYPRVPALRARATAKVNSLGGTDLRPEYGLKFRLVSRFVGWRIARRLQLAIQPRRPAS